MIHQRGLFDAINIKKIKFEVSDLSSDSRQLEAVPVNIDSLLRCTTFRNGVAI